MNSENFQPSINPVCLELIDFQFTGNIVPIHWYAMILRVSGKPDSVAVPLLADIIYWYRPVVIRSEVSGQVTGYRQKFKGHKLQKSYKEYSDLFGFGKKAVKNAIDNLIRLGLLTREFAHVITPAGHVMTNTMYLEPNIEKLAKISNDFRSSLFGEDGPPKKGGMVLPKKEGPSDPKNQDSPHQKGNHTKNTRETTSQTTAATAAKACSDCPFRQNPTPVPSGENAAAAAVDDVEIDGLIKQILPSVPMTSERQAWLFDSVVQYGLDYVREKIEYSNAQVKKPTSYFAYLGQALECNHGICYSTDKRAAATGGGRELADPVDPTLENSSPEQMKTIFEALGPADQDRIMEIYRATAPEHSVRMAEGAGVKMRMTLSSFRSFCLEHPDVKSIFEKTGDRGSSPKK